MKNNEENNKVSKVSLSSELKSQIFEETTDELNTLLERTKRLKEDSKDPRSRQWCFTWNNYTQDDIKYIQNTFDKFVFQEELCPTTNTPHLQGYIEFKNQIRFSTLKAKLPKCNLSKAKKVKGGDNAACIKYCQKERSRNGKIYARDIPIPEQLDDDEFDINKGYQWQSDILDLIKTKPDPRKIHWYWESKGNVGKSLLALHICMNNDAIIINGKANDIKHGIASYLEKNKKSPKVVIIDIPRTTEQKFVSYEAMECILNRTFFSGKYESCQVIFNRPHVIVFANEPPEEHRMSSDRWDINDINIKDEPIPTTWPSP